jgi:hypothetical protein
LQILSGLATRPLQASLVSYSTAQNTTNPSTNSTNNDNVRSAFPLAVVNSAAGRESWAVNPPVWMHNVSLVLPAMDYEALLILSGAGQSQLCFNTNSTQLADQLRPEFSSLMLAAVGDGWSWIVMESVVGWGINGSQTTFLPPPGWSPTYCPRSSLSSKTVRLIVGCTVAGVAVIILAVVAAVVVSRWVGEDTSIKFQDDGIQKHVIWLHCHSTVNTARSVLYRVWRPVKLHLQVLAMDRDK